MVWWTLNRQAKIFSRITLFYVKICYIILCFRRRKFVFPLKIHQVRKIKWKLKIGLVILQVVYIANVMNQKVINVSIVQKISVKRWIIDSNELIFWKNLVDAFCVWNQGTLIKRVLQNICRKYNGKHPISICDKGENRNSHDP